MLNAKALGLAGGVLWGVCLFIMTFANLYFGYGGQFLEIMMDVYPGFAASFVGAFIGFIYGFIDGFIGFFLIAWLYNKFS